SPDTVYDDAGRKRIARARNGVREFPATAAVLKWLRLPVTKYSNEPPLDDRTLLLHVAPDEDVQVCRRSVLHDVECIRVHLLRFDIFFFGLSVGHPVDHFRTGKHTSKRVIVARRDWIELVVMAAST